MFRWLIFAAFLFGTTANAQLSLTGAGGGIASSSSPPPSYTGPGDINAGATWWGGLRAYSAAVAATGTQKSVNIIRASDSTNQDILILTSGAFDTASYNTFVGTDATASCTIAGTAVVCTGASATLHVNDQITGVGITNPCVVTVTNGSTTATASLAGTSTTCGTVSVAETVTFQVAGFVAKVYAQAGTPDAVQATAAKQPQLLVPCLGALPCLFFNGAQFVATAIGGTVAQPFSVVGVIDITGNFSVQTDMLRGSGGAGGANTFYYHSGVNTAAIYGGAAISRAMADNAWHSMVGIYNGASGANIVDALSTAGGSGALPLGTTLYIGGDGGALTQFYTGRMAEIGVWPSAISTATTQCNNAFTYWATSVSC